MPRNREEGAYVVGVDAGGTKTQAVLVNLNGHVLAWGHGGPANPARCRPEQVRESLQQAIDAAIAGVPGDNRSAIKIICLGVAGARGREAMVLQALQHLDLDAEIMLDGDVQIAFWSAIQRRYGVAVIAGTGSIAYGIGLDGSAVTVGGWGYLVGDEGSGYAIGRAGMIGALMAEDGRGPETILLQKLLTTFNLSVAKEIVQPIYAVDGKDHIARFAPVVAEAAAEGDAVAREILAQAGHDLATCASTAVRRLKLGEHAFELALVGSVFKAGELLLTPLRQSVLASAPQAKIFVSQNAPALGAARLALAALNNRMGPPLTTGPTL